MSTGDPICPNCGAYLCLSGGNPDIQKDHVCQKAKVPESFWCGLQDCYIGKFVDMDKALNEPPPEAKRGVLWKTKCYLLGNLQDISAEEAISWRNYFQDEVKDMGIVCLNPLEKVFRNFNKEGKDFQKRMFDLLEIGDLETVHQEMKAVRRRDLAQIDFSNFLVGVLNTEARTYGVIEELSLAERSQKPIFLTIKPSIKAIPLWVAGMIKPSCIYSSLNNIIAELELINSGKKEISNDNWRIFEEEYL